MRFIIERNNVKMEAGRNKSNSADIARKVMSIIFAPTDKETKQASIGIYITTEKERGKGYGIELWRHVQKILDKEDLNVWISAVPQMQEKYGKFGYIKRGSIYHHDIDLELEQCSLHQVGPLYYAIQSFSEASDPMKKKILAYLAEKSTTSFSKYFEQMIGKKDVIAYYAYKTEDRDETIKPGEKQIMGVGFGRPLVLGGFRFVFYVENVRSMDELFRYMNRYEKVKRVIIDTGKTEDSKTNTLLLESYGSKMAVWCISMTIKDKQKEYDVYPSLETNFMFGS